MVFGGYGVWKLGGWGFWRIWEGGMGYYFKEMFGGVVCCGIFAIHQKA